MGASEAIRKVAEDRKKQAIAKRKWPQEEAANAGEGKVAKGDKGVKKPTIKVGKKRGWAKKRG